MYSNHALVFLIAGLTHCFGYQKYVYVNLTHVVPAVNGFYLKCFCCGIEASQNEQNPAKLFHHYNDVRDDNISFRQKNIEN